MSVEPGDEFDPIRVVQEVSKALCLAELEKRFL
jgi:hypothetical protein